ncbi:DUF4180 domain-containing protein [Actinomycetospora cinnamomea]|uniref:Uncharacterized protein DUF4180 n=1 Tax=Actinomycetospora cinnamomea TaxID=663609 RepID=A0A2U1EYG6_9PSEU|nr:DUF4180 domain-containing protein [Actinomycetospora cinnamomea]PVZ04952.1 uncharacterized protein DUF4180 [Actinomycetospora cinnamomea]
MTATTTVRHGVRVLQLSESGPAIAGESDATDLLGEAYGAQAEIVAVPVGRLTPEFVRLSSGVAGAIVQRFVNHRLRLVVIGSLDHLGPATGPVADWVHEANGGDDLWFVDDLDELDARLRGADMSTPS